MFERLKSGLSKDSDGEGEGKSLSSTIAEAVVEFEKAVRELFRMGREWFEEKFPHLKK